MKNLFGVAGGIFSFADDFLNTSYSVGVTENPDGFFLNFIPENNNFYELNNFFINNFFINNYSFLREDFSLIKTRKGINNLNPLNILGNGFRIGLFYFNILKDQNFFLSKLILPTFKFYEINEFLFSWVFTQNDKRRVSNKFLYEISFILGYSLVDNTFFSMNFSEKCDQKN